jgi:hypothetical protein
VNAVNLFVSNVLVWLKCPRRIFSDISTLENETTTLSSDVDRQSPTDAAHMPEERRPQLHRCVSLKTRNWRSVWTPIVALNLLKPSGNLRTTRFNIKKFYVVPTLRLCVLYGSQNKQQLLPYKTLRDCFLKPTWRVFTARYALSLYIEQTRFVFKGLISSSVLFRKLAQAVRHINCAIHSYCAVRFYQTVQHIRYRELWITQRQWLHKFSSIFRPYRTRYTISF